ncbi:MAG: hypothetical protein AB1635_02570 [Acidobacteriota bacterium]
MEFLIFERRHATGVVARVYRESEGAGYRPATDLPPDPGDAPEWPYVDTIDEAQAAADAEAHPGCRGEGCSVWTPVVGGARPPE